ncbi:mediator of RNA polymerase II transcription subunit 27 isoform X5 [Rhineura floridana]|uniref:mediator of RNA polymerase II transcription subunit 27 isoform X5 n=1 Tax=Rhineura floridana TaxID=261503 RepID=UPI002AC7EC4A|nr:mediator of RNA polymerase II transcription subunit 27 isoform X5 [Rhineura floridana]
MADGVLSAGVNLEAFAQAIAAIQALRSSVTRVFDCLKDGKRHKEALEGREKSFVSSFQESLHSVSRDLGELERLSNLVGKPSENHPLHNSGLLSLDPVQDKTPLYSQLLQAYKWSNKTLTLDWPWLLPWLPSSVLLLGSLWSPHVPPLHVMFPLHVNLETPTQRMSSYYWLANTKDILNMSRCSQPTNSISAQDQYSSILWPHEAH